jgi:CspA family cold shock protein
MLLTGRPVGLSAIASAPDILFFVRLSFMAQGTVKKLVSDKGFGFISGDRGDVFFHHSSVVGGSFDNLQEGQSVEYEIEQGKGGKGPRAINVKPA